MEDLEDQFTEGSVNTSEKSSHVVRADHRATSEAEFRGRGTCYASKGEDLPQQSLHLKVASLRSSQDGTAGAGPHEHIEDIPSGIHDSSSTFKAKTTPAHTNPNSAVMIYALTILGGLDSEERFHWR